MENYLTVQLTIKSSKIIIFLVSVPAGINAEGVERIIAGRILAAEVQQFLRRGDLIAVLRQVGQLWPVVLVLVVAEDVETVGLRQWC